MRSKLRLLRPVPPLLFIAVACCCPLAAEALGPPPAISPTRLPAAGRHAAAITVSEAGRYAVTAASGPGTALQLIDRQAGPGEISGSPGERDGRLDLLLDRGTYRLVTIGADDAAGEARLEARPFVELSAPRPRLLVEGKTLGSTLGDLEQRSWWLQVDTARRVILEAAGRNLSDLRLFRDGGWLVDAAPRLETLEPEPGRPLRCCRIAARLEPGLYLVTAFGGPDEPWAAGGKEHPLHVRFGIPSLGNAGRTRYLMSPFGVDRYIVPASTTFVQLELPEARPARLETAPFPANDDPFGEPEHSAEITKKSREPVATIGGGFGEQDSGEEGAGERDSGDQTGEGRQPATEPRLITVRSAAGQPYVLQHFELRESYTFQRSGRYWLGSVHSGHPQDSADATAIVTAETGGRQRGLEPALTQTVEIGTTRGWARRCNLLGPLNVFFRVGEAGSYEVLLRGTSARARFEPFLVTRPENYREPALKPGGTSWKLDAGWHVLTVIPDEPGIVELAVRPAGKLDAIWDLLDPGRAMRGDPVRAAVAFPAIDLDWKNAYTAHLNTRPGVISGLVLRELPIDLVRPLPLSLRPGEEIAVMSRVPEPGTIRAEGESGEILEVRTGAAPWVKGLETAAGTMEVRVRNPGAATVLAALRFDAARLRPETPLPDVPDAALRPPPEFPPLTGDQPRFFDLDRGGSATFSVQAAAPAFHTIESTGLLETSGTLRSRFLPSLAGAAAGGSGRNFLIGSYLQDGDYQLTVQAQGRSRGHLGVRLRRAALVDGGELREGIPSRVTVAAAEGSYHDFTIAEAGTYRLFSSAAGSPLPCRLEEADGWPIERPGEPARFERRFDAGRYRLLLLPGAVGSRRVTMLERVTEPPRFDGHGPHRLPLNTTVEHVWLEPEGQAPDAGRLPDRWVFELPAPATLTVVLTGEMQGEIGPADTPAGGAPLARVQPGRGWSGRLPAGRYALAAVCSRRNNRAPYQVAVQAAELLAGTTRSVTAPVTIPVSVEGNDLFEFSTTGSADVRARLTDASGAVIAEQEDRTDDWNVQFAARLGAGTYELELLPTGTESAPTRVSLRAIAERTDPPLAPPASREVRPGDQVAVLPLEIPAGVSLLAVRAGADETIGLAVDHDAGGAWKPLWGDVGRSLTLEMPLATAPSGGPAPRYRLRVWSLDRRGGAVRLVADALTPPRVSENDLHRGMAVAASSRTGIPAVFAEVALERPGVVRFTPPTPWRASGAAHQPLGIADTVASAGTRIWVAADLEPGAREAALRGTRVAVIQGQPVSIELPADGSAVECDVVMRHTGPLLATARAAAGRPGVAVVSRDKAGLTSATATATAAIGESTATAVIVADGPTTALLWQADPSNPARRATLSVFEYASSAGKSLAAGRGEGAVDAAGASSLSLPRGAKRVRLTLGRGLAAALLRDGVAESVHDAADNRLDETVETAADTLVIVNAGDVASPWSAEIVPLEARDRAPALTETTPRVQTFPTAGTARIPVAPDDGRGAPLRLQTVGAEGQPTYLAGDGRILSGSSFAVGSGGTLLLPHGRGLAAAWVERPAGKVPGIWGEAPAPREVAVETVALIRLEGPTAGFAAKVAAPSVLHLRTEEPFVGVVRRPGSAPESLVQLRGATLNLTLAPGTTTVWLRAPSGGDLRGSAEVLIAPVTAIGEGAGPEVMIAPGATRSFSFTVEREGPVGIGVRAAPDTASCRLLDASGRSLGTGILQMPRLAPGTYLLEVQAPPDGGPVTARPALAGLVPPGSGPPEEVVRRYLRLSRGEGEDEGYEAPRPLAADEAGD